MLRPVEQCLESSKKLQIRNLSNQNDENLAIFGGRRGGTALASSMPQQCLPPSIPHRNYISGCPVGLMACRIKLSK